jgi:hypothetical protein
MPIEPEYWKGLIGGSLVRLSDERYQRLAWFNKHQKEETSPDEQICQLMDDYQFKDFLAGQPLSEVQKLATGRLIDALKAYGGKSTKPLNPWSSIDDPEWSKIRELAQNVIVVLGPLIDTVTYPPK